MDLGGLGDMDATATLAAASVGVRARRLGEVHEMLVLAHWAELHGADPTQGPDGHIARRLGDVLVQLGGEGTPPVQDHCLGEIALARETSDVVTANVIADVLDLQHRLPLTWVVVAAGECEAYVARRVARMSRHLPADRVGVVDRAVAAIIGTESAGRVLGVAEAKVIEADPDLHEARVEEQARRRYAALGRRDEYGLRAFVARLDSGDAMWLDATLARVADLIEDRHPDTGIDERRSIALGMLARPAEVFALLCEHTDPELDLDTADPLMEDEPVVNRALAFPADLLEALSHLDLSVLAPKSVVYAHLHEAALTGAATGVARVEGLGPMTLAALQGLLARTDVVVKPVIDLSDRVAGTSYEFPESIKERAHLATGGDYWPYATSTSRHCDYDHVTPYEGTGPPGQTSTANCGPLSRRHHRWKTHAGYRSRQCGANRYVWLTPHGLAFITDHHGTRMIPRAQAEAIYDAPAGVDIYF